jgi:hypothetical protein
VATPAENRLGIDWQPYDHDDRCLPYPFYPADGGRPFFVRPNASHWQPGQRQPDSYRIGQELYTRRDDIGAYEVNEVNGRSRGIAVFGGFLIVGFFVSLGGLAPLGGVIALLGVPCGIVIGIRNILSPRTPRTRHPLDPRQG